MIHRLKYWLAKTGIMSNLTIRITTVIISIAALTSIIIQLNSFSYTYDSVDSHNDHTSRHRIEPKNDSLFLDDKYEHVFVFIQVTDLHLSINFDPTRGPDFRIFCTEVIDTVKPSVTLVTGDLTDARTRRLMAGEQYESEWQEYQSITRETGVASKTLWLDVRGNHDNFGVFGVNDSRNYFSRYSVQGQHHNSHYSFTIPSGNETYAFVAVDACLSPGPNRPFNTVGLLHKADIDALRNIRSSLKPNNMTIWFGHYPTRAITCPASPNSLSDVITGPYLSGHIHMTDLYALRSQGFLDIELADWRARRKYRVAVLDHNVFSFSDVVLHEWPVIVITNPKGAAFQMPVIEPLHRILSSTHIRALVFAPTGVQSVSCRIGADGDWVPMTRVRDTNLYVSPWDPEKYLSGMHVIQVKARDTSGTERNASHVFSFDGSKPEFGLKSKFIMNVPHHAAWGTGFIIVVVLTVLPLVAFRLFDAFTLSRKFRIRCQRSLPCYLSPFAKLYLLTCVDRVFLPVISIPLYLTFGPWLIGQVIAGHYAICFVFGMWIEGYFLPGGVSYVLGMIFILVVHIPFTFLLAHSVHCRYKQLTRDSAAVQEGQCRRVFHWRHLFAWIWLGVHFFFTIIYADGYGAVAWITGVAHTWTLFLNAYLWYSTMDLQLSDFRPMQKDARGKIESVDAAFADVGNRRDNESSDLLKERTD